MTISVVLTDEQEAALLARAKRLHLAPQDLAVAAIRNFLAQQADFEGVADRVIEKNRDLYRRLA